MQDIHMLLTLSIPVQITCKDEIDRKIVPGTMAEVIENTYYDEGRYAFDRELLTHALRMIVRHAVQELAFKHFDKCTNGEMVPYVSEDGTVTGATRRALIDSEAFMKNNLQWIDVRPTADVVLEEVPREQFIEFPD